MATIVSQFRLSGLAQRLVTEGYLSESVATSAQETVQKKRTSLVNYLIQQKLVAPREMMLAASAEFGIPALDLSVLDLDMVPTKLISEKTIRQHNALPLYKRENRLYVAIHDPTNLSGLDEIKFSTGMRTEPVLVEQDKLNWAVEKVLDILSPTMQALMDEGLDTLELSAEEEDGAGDITDIDVDDAPVVRFIHKVMLEAITKRASDIHFEPYEKIYRVRLRIDGILRDVASPPPSLALRIASRLKVMARLDISERRIPQDGRIKLNFSKRRAINFRMSTVPTLYGEKVVLRILDTSNILLKIDHLGFEEKEKDIYLKMLTKPWGMILVTGPTGSGKTVTLYTGLSILNTVDRNISTAEDPVEIFLPGVNQVSVNPKVGLTFATALRAFLRQDPDVIMVGEIRDLETAEIAIKAAQTGHLVLSTLHTNDAPQTLTRLSNMGVPSYNIASSVSLIMAQRLLRKLCPVCKQADHIPEEALVQEGFHPEEISRLKIYKAVGCEQCIDGYKGRTALYQVMSVSEEMGRIIMQGCDTIALAKQAEREGVATLRLSGLDKVRLGVTSLHEVNRVTKD
jgi:type IV pilus assembly protein PilB